MDSAVNKSKYKNVEQIKINYYGTDIKRPRAKVLY